MDTPIGIDLSETETEAWHIGEDGRTLAPVVYTHSPSAPIQEAGRRGDAYWHAHSEGEKAKEGVRRSIANGNPRWKGVPEERWPHKVDSYRVFFEGGRVGVSAEEPIAEEYLMLIKRFGEVFGYAHSRYKELQQKEAQNRRLAVEAAVQRLRAEVQSMDEASDFERILSLLTESLKTVELSFDGCEIDVLDEPVENPTMETFEANGFRYTNNTLDPGGSVGTESYNLLAPFPRTTRQTIERFIAGEPWQGLSDDLRIVEVPAGGYGRLRLTQTDREPFTDDEVATLREFADAVALGYARYLDIREIQEATERKSAFLASMSHELRTPMNAIKGFANLILRRETGGMSERAQENLGKIDQASNHLLAMLNDLLDLSKIEAGRMDVTPERFDVGELVTSACDTVSPLIQEGVELLQEVADDIGDATTDKARLQQMIINLLSNAIKFTDSGNVTVNASQSDGQLIIAVSGVFTSDYRSFRLLKRSARPENRRSLFDLVEMPGLFEDWVDWGGRYEDGYDAAGWLGMASRQAATAQSMIDALEKDIEPRANGENARAVLELAIAMRESERRGHQPVTLPLEDRSLQILPAASRMYYKKEVLGEEWYAQQLASQKRETL